MKKRLAYSLTATTSLCLLLSSGATKATAINAPESKDLCRILSDDFEIQKPKSENDLRTFNGVANSGKPFVYYGMKTIIDFDGLTHHETTPFLYEHDRKCDTGHGKLAVENNELAVNGVLLSSEWGKKVADGYDEGFPWQLSIDVRAKELSELKTGDKATINGNEVVGPMLIMRQCSIIEVSFTPTGVDTQTHVRVLSDDGNQSTELSTAKEKSMTEQELKDEVERLKTENQKLKDKIAELEDTAKKANVEAELSQAGFAKDKDQKWLGISPATHGMVLSASDEDRKAIIDDLKANKSDDNNSNGIPLELLSPQHQTQTQNGVQLSDNALVAEAQSRNNQENTYV